VEHGVPLFLTQLSETLRLETTSAPFPTDAIGATAARHGGELLRSGFTVSQVVHDYGDICQTITAPAVEQSAPIAVEEFHILNRCLDTAIAEAVTEHARLTAETRSAEETERLGHAAHELRDTLNTAILAFHTLKRGDVAVTGSTGAILGQSLMSLRDVVSKRRPKCASKLANRDAPACLLSRSSTRSPHRDCCTPSTGTFSSASSLLTHGVDRR
jgi:hypothetical protein